MITETLPVGWGREVSKDSFFSEEKEAKRLYSIAPGSGCLARGKVEKVFWFFFSKKNRLLPC
jgi:hypothetical protein